jgi:hypothetical protein
MKVSDTNFAHGPIETSKVIYSQGSTMKIQVRFLRFDSL